jgi:predicted nucleic acid-binding protein
MGRGARGETFLCDTTVLFAASDAGHRHHQPSLAVVAGASPSRAFVAAHSLAELYATLTGTPAPAMRRVDQVLEAVEQAAKVFAPVVLSLDDYLWVLRHMAAVGGRSGQVYDALILKCAERAKVEVVYTWNTLHFQRLAWADLAARIRSPPA